MTRSTEPDLALIVGAARSGTTLLRSLLDAHPEIGCPAEAGLPGLVAHARRVWTTVCTSYEPHEGDPLAASAPELSSPQPIVALAATAEREIRHTAMAIMKYYCAAESKHIYCDKSLDTAHHLPVVYHYFPHTRAIILVRHVMDTIASGLEASPWGFNAFGYMPFIQASPENTVMALARYWEMQVGLALKWQAEHDDLCHRVRYEDLVAYPAQTLSRICRFLGVRDDPAVLSRAFTQFSAAAGPGDYKLAFTTGVDATSVGRGRAVPVALLPDSLLERINEHLEQLGYPPMTRSWNAEPGANGALPETARRLDVLMASMSDGPWELPVDLVALVADDDKASRWILDVRTSAIRRGDGDVDLAVLGSTADLIAFVTGDVNVAVLLRSGRIRHVTAAADGQMDMPRMLTALVRRFRDRQEAAAALTGSSATRVSA
jgi:hypothetical protein